MERAGASAPRGRSGPEQQQRRMSSSISREKTPGPCASSAKKTFAPLFPTIKEELEELEELKELEQTQYKAGARAVMREKMLQFIDFIT